MCFHYERLSNIAFINDIFEKGFCINILSNGMNRSGLIQYLILVTMFLYQGIGSQLTWNDPESILLVGNFSKGFGLSKNISFLFITFSGIISVILIPLTAIKVTFKDGPFEQFVGLIKLVTGNPCTNSVNDIGEELVVNMVEKMVKQLRPLMFGIRVSMNTYIPLLVFALIFGGFWNQSITFVTSWKLLLVIFWSTALSVFVLQMFWSQSAAIVSTIIVCQFIVYRSELISNQAKKSEETDTSFLRERILEQLNTVKLIEGYNQTMKWILGVMLTYYSLNYTLLMFLVIDSNEWNYTRIAFLYFLPIQFVMFMIYIILPSRSTMYSRKAVNGIKRMFDDGTFSFSDRLKYASILHGLNVNDSFDCFDYISHIDYVHAFWVSFS